MVLHVGNHLTLTFVSWRSGLPGKIFDSIIGYLQHPEIGRARVESAIFTYLIVLAMQGAFSCSAKAGSPSGHDPDSSFSVRYQAVVTS